MKPHTEIPAALLVQIIIAGDLLAVVAKQRPDETARAALGHWLNATSKLDRWIDIETNKPQRPHNEK
tara:strand:+ start:1475 stop:1675 length:201 start_codon:yes stop_codon:yes gene_type:complete